MTKNRRPRGFASIHLRRWLPSRNDPVLVPASVMGRLGDSVSLALAQARGESGRLRVWWLCTLAAIVLLVSVVSIPVRAASPSSGAVSQASPSLTWNGPLYVMSTPVPEARPPAADPANGRCDHFFLHIHRPVTFCPRTSDGR